jgi:CMP-N-acetylneuraminic acid synthetase
MTIRKPSVVAIVPMRHDSKRVPGKNWRDLGGRPLFHHIVSTLLRCDRVTQVVIDTDSPIVREQARRHFPQVMLLDRPEHLRADTTPMNDVLVATTHRVEADLYLQTHSTNPLLLAETVNGAIDRFVAAGSVYDSLFGVSRVQARLWDQLARPINHNPAILLRTQDLPPVFLENSCLYLFTRDVLERHHNRIGARPMLLEIDRDEAWDIDEEVDFRIAELLYADRQRRAAAVA